MEKWKKRFLIYLGIGIFLLLVDQVTKIMAIGHQGTLIPGLLDISLVENRGGTFGVGQNSTFTFIVTTIIVIGIILRFMMVRKEELDFKTGFALSMIIAGGIGNLIDRLLRGYVVDFIDFSKWIPFPVFNLADCFVVIGIFLLLIFFGIYTYQKRKGKEEEKLN